ncbi:MAG: Rne/Rng family ribonuclease, partial [Myxococcaceae bacterium]
MSSILVINAAGRETRVALVENGHIAEFYLERKKDKGVVGNIYKGRVVRVLPGMQAAFVDIGLEKAAFLYVSDVYYDPEFSRAQFELTEGEHDEAPEIPEFNAETDLDHEGLLDAPAEGLPGRTITGEFPAVSPSAAATLGAEAQALGAEPARPATDAGPSADAPQQAALTPGEATPAPEIQAPASSDAGANPEAVAAPSESAPGLAALEQAPAPAVDASSTAGAEVVAAAIAQATEGTPTGSEVVAAAIAQTGGSPDARGERRTPRDHASREKHRRGGRDERGRGRDEEKPKPRKSARIEDLLKVGQEVLVQISKDPIGTKGARLTSHISIPGRHLVFMPTVDHVGISRRIANEKER